MFIHSEELATSFLIEKKMFPHNIDSKCPKCGSDVKYFMRSEGGKFRKILQCENNECQTILSIRLENIVLQ